jgi:hypothetical protein
MYKLCYKPFLLSLKKTVWNLTIFLKIFQIQSTVTRTKTMEKHLFKFSCIIRVRYEKFTNFMHQFQNILWDKLNKFSYYTIMKFFLKYYNYKKFDISCRIFEHFATKPNPVIEFIKLRSAVIFKHFATNWIQ